MSVASQSVAKTENRFFPLAICGAVLILLLAGLLRALGVSLVTPALAVGAVAVVWVAFRHPIGSLGGVLALMPIYPLTFLLAKFFGPPFMQSSAVKALDKISLLLLVGILCWRSNVKLRAPDLLLLACVVLAVLRFCFRGSLLPLVNDFDLVIGYAAGRLALLTVEQQGSWARRAFWLVAVLSVLGMIEVFFIGEGPRATLYLSVADVATEGAELNGTFRAAGFNGLRESSTMFGPLQFAALCMLGLILWWVYSKKILLPGIAIFAGLICTVTRGAWIATTLAIFSLAIAMGQKKRFFTYTGWGLALFIALIPVIGIGEFLSATKSKQDPSAEAHVQGIGTGVQYILDHPLGVGPGNAGKYDTITGNQTAPWIENAYLTLAEEYGIATSLCFIGFIASALLVVWRKRTSLGYAATGILVGFSALMCFFPCHDIFVLACWVWFPVGLAVGSSTDMLAPAGRPAAG